MNWDSIHDTRKANQQEYDRLAAGSIGRRAPEVGERVLLNAGLVGHGHLWERQEAVVTEVSDNCCKVKFKDDLLQQTYEMWVPIPVITDLLGKLAKSDT